VGFTVVLTACSAAAQTSPSAAVTEAQTPSAAASVPGLVATTEPAASVAPPGAVTVSMTSFMFMPMSPTAKAGTVVFFLKDDDPLTAPVDSHNLVIASDLGHPLASSDYVYRGKPAVFTVQGLAAGHYVIWCSVPNHANNGMVGTLTLTP
jgi:plastocyanin